MAEVFTKNLGKVCLTCDGYWNSTKHYDRLCLVTVEYSDGKVEAYISRKDVPAGVAPVKGKVSEYWQLIYTCDGEVKKKYSLTINTVPNAAIVKMNGEIVSSKYKEFDEGTIVTVEVSCSGYVTKTKVYTLNKDIVDTIVLEEEPVIEKYTVTIGTPVPNNAIIKVNNIIREPGYSFEVDYGTIVNITATADNYEDFEETYTIVSDTTITPILAPIPQDRVFTINNKSSSFEIEIPNEEREVVLNFVSTLNGSKVNIISFNESQEIESVNINNDSNTININISELIGYYERTLYVSFKQVDDEKVITVTIHIKAAIYYEFLVEGHYQNFTRYFPSEPISYQFPVVSDKVDGNVRTHVYWNPILIRTIPGMDIDVSVDENNLIVVNRDTNYNEDRLIATITLQQSESYRTITVEIIQEGINTYIRVEDSYGNEIDTIYYSANGIPCNNIGEEIPGATQQNGQNLYIKSNTNWNVT